MFVFVQIFDDACVLSVEPAAMVPTAPPPDVDAFAPGFDVTVLPLGVVVVVGTEAGGVGRGAGVFVRGVGRDGRLAGCGAGRVETGAGAGVVLFGTSLSCGCAVVSRFASARSRLSELSAPRAVLSPFFASERHAESAERTTSVATEIGAANRRLYFNMDFLLK